MRVRFSLKSWPATTRATRGRISLAAVLMAGGLVGSALLPGCARNEQDGTASGTAGTGAEITGTGGISTGPGGQGAGPTGTEGDAPGDNPASQASEEQQKAEQ
jgi:hypothetical protein